MKLTSTLIATLLFSGVASAHNVWLEPESNLGTNKPSFILKQN